MDRQKGIPGEYGVFRIRSFAQVAEGLEYEAELPMTRWAYLAALALVFATRDVSRTYDLRPPTPGILFLTPPGTTLASEPVSPNVFVSVAQQSAPAKKAAPLHGNSRLEIVRYVSGEFARAVKPLPGAKKGFRIAAGKPLNEAALRQVDANTGIAVNPGDTVQITRIEFREKEIVFDLNGGSGHKFRLKDHLQIGIGGVPTVSTVSSTGGARPVPGATLILDYGKALPDMSPDDVKSALSVVLDFEKEKSAAVNWVDTLPPEFKKAIEDGHAAVGMDHDMVIAALGRPDHKVRERNDQGDETEDWIYGNPPAKTVFVTFLGDKVIRVKEFD